MLIARHHYHCDDGDGLNLHNHIYHGYLDRHRLGHDHHIDPGWLSNEDGQ